MYLLKSGAFFFFEFPPKTRLNGYSAGVGVVEGRFNLRIVLSGKKGVLIHDNECALDPPSLPSLFFSSSFLFFAMFSSFLPY